MRRYRTLDGLRGVAAIFVVLHHFANSYQLPWPRHAYLAVDMFFCLSGFVLTRGYGERLAAGMPFTEWMGVRLRRLYPLYFLSIVLALLSTVLLPGFPGSELGPVGRTTAFLTNLLMLPSPTWQVMPAMFPLNFVGWSLFVEMLLSIQFFWTSRTSTNFVWKVLLTGLAILLVIRLTLGGIAGGWAWHDAPAGLARGIFSFSAGMLIARKRQGTVLVSGLAWLPLAVVAAILMADPPHGAAYDLLAIVVAFPLITLISIQLEPPTPTAFTVLGDLSYPCYALHPVVFYAIASILGFRNEHPGTQIVGTILLVAFLGGCLFVDRYYDVPLRRLAGTRSMMRRGAQAAP